MCEEYSPYFLVARLISCSGFGDSFDCVKDSSSKNIQEIIFLVGVLIRNDAVISGGRM